MIYTLNYNFEIMILAIDVHYKDNGTAKAVGVLFNWDDKEPKQIIEKNTNDVEDYIPGQFYKRELPCIQLITDTVNLSEIDCLIVDGHVFVDNDKAYGLGGYTWEALGKQIPIIGVAKRAFHKNEDTCI